MGASLCLCFFILLLNSTVARATSILRLSFDQLVEQSALVFEGKVVSSEAHWNQQHTRIHTYVKFEISEIIKGRAVSDSITLRFAGGQVGEDHQKFESMIYPLKGESGIYFVERVDINMVNPLIGWSQGHFLINGDKMMTNQHRTIIKINPVSKARKNSFSLSEGEVKGMLSTSRNSNLDAGLSVSEFKRLIRAQAE